MNLVNISIAYFLTVPVLFFLASKSYNRVVYLFLLLVIVLLSLVPIALGIYLLGYTFKNSEGTAWTYVTGIAGLFCVTFGASAAIPVYWLYKQK